MNPNEKGADKVFLVASLTGAIAFGACVYSFLQGCRVASIKSPEDSPTLPGEDSENADNSPDPDGDE